MKDSAAAAATKASDLMLTLSGIILGMMMVMLDSTAMNVAIPRLSEDFHASFQTLQWAITGYMLAMSASIPLSGWFSDCIGARNAFLACVISFMLGSLLCSFAQTAEQLIAYRVIQGLGGGMIQPIGMAIAFRLSPEGSKGKVMGLLGIPMLLAPASGPVLSGFMLEFGAWQWIFLINLPIGAIALAAGMRYLKNSGIQPGATLDLIGVVLGLAAFVLITLGIDEMGQAGILASLKVLLPGMVLLLLFVRNELRIHNPIMELRAFRSASFRRGVTVSWVQYVALNGSIVFIPQLLQKIMGSSPLESGLFMSVLALTSGGLMPLSGRIFDRFGIRIPAFSGLLIIALALMLLSGLGDGDSPSLILAVIALLGSGMGLSMMSLNTYILQSAPPDLISRVTPLTSASAQVVISFAIAGLGAFLNMRSIANNAAGNLSPAAESAAAYGDTFLLAAGIAAVGALISLGLRKEPDKRKH
ncbi:putative transport protein HsrA [compost metagenome]